MIKVIGRKLDMSKTESEIGFQSDNNVETRLFEVTRKSLFDFDFKLDLKNGDYEDIIDLLKEIVDGKAVLTWVITRENLLYTGLLQAQLRAFSGNDEVWHSEISYFNINRSMNITDIYPEILPTEFIQMEQRVTAIQSDVVEKGNEVESDRAEVATNTATVLTKAGEAIQSAAAALLSEQNAKTSETNAKGYSDNTNEKADIVVSKEEIVSTKHSEVISLASQVSEDKTAVLSKAAEVESDRAEVASNTTTVNTKAGEALQSAANAYTSEVSARESAEDAHDSETEATRQAGIALNNILNGVSTHDADDASHPSILSDIDRIEAIARGKATAKVFLTVAAMNDWLAVTGNVETLNVGDNLYIVDISVPDYWWDGTEAQVLEAEAVNLADYYTKTEVDNRLPIAIEQSDYDVLVANGQEIAGRIYNVVPDGELS